MACSHIFIEAVSLDRILSEASRRVRCLRASLVDEPYSQHTLAVGEDHIPIPQSVRRAH